MHKRGGTSSSTITPRQRGKSLVLPLGARIYLDFQFVYSSMRLLVDIKMKIKHAVESSYEFDTSRTPDIISRNASRAKALLSEKKSFVYRVRLIASPFFSQLSIAMLVSGTQHQPTS